jgi:hypothetical protein
MKELIKTNNAVRLSFLKAVLDDAGIKYAVLDNQMASVLGSAFGSRLMVDEADLAQARRLMETAEKDIESD